MREKKQGGQQTSKPIDWDYWLSQATMELWRAVGLVYGHMPSKVFQDTRGEIVEWKTRPENPERYLALLERAKKVTTPHGPIHIEKIKIFNSGTWPNDASHAEVSLLNVATFFSIELEPPSPLANLLAQGGASHPNDDARVQTSPEWDGNLNNLPEEWKGSKKNWPDARVAALRQIFSETNSLSATGRAFDVVKETIKAWLQKYAPDLFHQWEAQQEEKKRLRASLY